MGNSLKMNKYDSLYYYASSLGKRHWQQADKNLLNKQINYSAGMSTELSVATLLAVMSFIYSTPVGNEQTRDTCFFKDGVKTPYFLYYLTNEQFIEIGCSRDTCLCDGSNTGYTGCQSCCCTIREKREGNESFYRSLALSIEAFSGFYLRWSSSAKIIASW